MERKLITIQAERIEIRIIAVFVVEIMLILRARKIATTNCDSGEYSIRNAISYLDLAKSARIGNSENILTVECFIWIWVFGRCCGFNQNPIQWLMCLALASSSVAVAIGYSVNLFGQIAIKRTSFNDF